MCDTFTYLRMDQSQPHRRSVVRTAGLVLATGGVSTLAGCGDPGDGDGEEGDDDGYGYREDELDP